VYLILSFDKDGQLTEICRRDKTRIKIYCCVWLKPETMLLFFNVIYFNCFIFVDFWILICSDSRSLFYAATRICLSIGDVGDVFAFFVSSAVNSVWNYVPMKKKRTNLYICRVVDQVYVCFSPHNNWCLWKACICTGVVSTFFQIVYKSNPITGLDRPWGFQGVEAPRFQDNRHTNMVRLSAVRTGRLYPPGNIPDTHFC
jgi:hypothetical protein